MSNSQHVTVMQVGFRSQETPTLESRGVPDVGKSETIWSFFYIGYETLATWCEEPTHWIRLMLGKTGSRRRRRQRMRWSDGINNSMDMNLSKLQEQDRGAWHTAVHGVIKSWISLSDETTTHENLMSSYLQMIWFLPTPSRGFTWKMFRRYLNYNTGA